MTRSTPGALLAALLLAGCASAGAGAGLGAEPAQCDARFGNAPRARERSLASAAVGIADILGACAARAAG